MKTFTKIIIALAMVIALGAFAPTVNAQTILSTTTLGAAITSSTCSTTTVTLASTSTMQGIGTQQQANTVLYIDMEYFRVNTVVDSTHVTVFRCFGALGESARPRPHINGATVWFANTSGANPAASFGFSNGDLLAEHFGACTASTELALPIIYLQSGDKMDCIGASPNGQWVITSRPGPPVLGATYTVPAGAIVPPGTIFLTDTGTAAATSITVPNGWAPGMCLTIIPGGAFTTTTAGNVRIATTAVVGKALFECWDGVKWDPSY